MRLLSSLRAASGIRQERVRSPPAPMLALSIRAIRAAVWNDVSSTRTSGAAGRRQPRVSPRSAARDRIPAQPRLSGRRRGSLSLQPLDHHRLEQRREARLRVRPRQGSCWTPCSVPRIPGTAEPHQRSVQHRVQMPPRPGGGGSGRYPGHAVPHVGKTSVSPTRLVHPTSVLPEGRTNPSASTSAALERAASRPQSRGLAEGAGSALPDSTGAEATCRFAYTHDSG